MTRVLPACIVRLVPQVDKCKLTVIGSLAGAAKTGALSTALVLAASNFFPAFNRKLNVSSKTALCVSGVRGSLAGCLASPHRHPARLPVPECLLPHLEGLDLMGLGGVVNS